MGWGWGQHVWGWGEDGDNFTGMGCKFILFNFVIEDNFSKPE